MSQAPQDTSQGLRARLLRPPSHVGGVICVLLSAVCFSLAGVLIKLVPWSALSIGAGRSIFAALVVYGYMRLRGGRMVWNKQTLAAAAINLAMVETFVLANKLTTAANTIVLQFTEPIWVILFAWLIFRNRPRRAALLACALIFVGILCFFLDQLSPTGMLGSALAIFSGMTYALVFLFKKFDGCDFESATIISFLGCLVVGIPSLAHETQFGPSVWAGILVLGIVQLGLAYVLLSRGLDSVSPVTASLTSTVEPILNPILAALFLGEAIGPLSLVGAVLVVGTATLYNVYSARKEQQL